MRPIFVVALGLLCPLQGAAQATAQTGDTVSGTFAPAGPPARPAERTPAGTGCMVDVTQRYDVSGTLQGTFTVDYRILVHGPCGEPLGSFDEEWLAIGSFDGTIRGRPGAGTFSYTAAVRSGGEVHGYIVFGDGMVGELTVRGNFGNGRLSYNGSATRERVRSPAGGNGDR